MWADVVNKPKGGRPFRLDRSYLMNVTIDYNNDLELLQTHPSLLPKAEPLLANSRHKSASVNHRSVLGDHRIPIEWLPIGKFPINENHSSIGQYSPIGQYFEYCSIGQYLSIGQYFSIWQYWKNRLSIGQYSLISQSEMLVGRSHQTYDNMRQLIDHTNQRSNSNQISMAGSNINCDREGWFTSATF